MCWQPCGGWLMPSGNTVPDQLLYLSSCVCAGSPVGCGRCHLADPDQRHVRQRVRQQRGGRLLQLQALGVHRVPLLLPLTGQFDPPEIQPKMHFIYLEILPQMAFIQSEIQPQMPFKQLEIRPQMHFIRKNGRKYDHHYIKREKIKSKYNHSCISLAKNQFEI